MEKEKINLNEEELKILINQNKIMMKNFSNALIRHMIMYLLLKEELHGYALMKKIDEFFKPQIEKEIMKKIPTSKIYPILNKMEEEGLITSKEDEHNNMKIKVYSPTSKGKRIYYSINNQINETINRNMWKDLLNEIN